ncbi:MAG: UDP-N-acetylmuramate--L-alanine ligase [Sphingobacteriales bacterium]|nr:MAG: UDP-N-acetylmuramate--L-alanine ligase [Sphingobacteriales bacterium]
MIYTPAVPKDSEELNHFLNNGYMVKKRAEILAALTQGKTTIAVAGTHGKTSTAAIISHILYTAKIPFFSFLGGIASNFNTNFIAPENGKADLIVVEADEFDRSFLQLNPDVAIITAVEADHLDIYGTFDELQKAYSDFGAKTKQNGKLIIEEKAHISSSEKMLSYRYGTSAGLDISATNIRVENGMYVFDADLNGEKLPNLAMAVPGMHNIENALAAMAATREFINSTDSFYEALKTFKGVKRRFEVIYKSDDKVFIDDYAHHPTEIKVTVETVKNLYPNKKVLGIFQPHLFSRTKDFATEFAQSLNLLDEILLLPIYPAREKPMIGVTSRLILDDIKNPNKRIVDKEELIQYLMHTNADVILTIGAGDIDKLITPIKQIFINKATVTTEN